MRGRAACYVCSVRLIVILLLVAATLLSVCQASRPSPRPWVWDFWTLYARAIALLALPFFGWLVFKAGSATGSWWSSAPAVTLVTAILGAIAPATTFIVSWAKIRLDDKRQQHEITGDYLNRALDAEQPLAARHQLLRFLSTAPHRGDRLHAWAAAELSRIAPAYERQEQDAQRVQAEIANAKSPKELELAEQKLRAVIGRTERSMGKPPVPKASAAALKAGMFRFKDVGGLGLPGTDLTDADMQGIKMPDSDLSGAKLVRTRFPHADARRTNFDRADMLRAVCTGADLRGSSFVDANLTKADLSEAHLGACDFTRAILVSDCTWS